MRTATALSITAIGAIFAFAITAHPSFLNLQAVGWILILTGICGLVIPRRGRGWLRRTVLVKGSPDFTATPHRGDVLDPAAPVPGTVLSRSAIAGDDTVPAADGPVERESIVEFMEK
ncbi:MAG TPA: hypothetical protein VLX31_18960 [Streptosporangiaceae bacterium]|nr:hypothetical protein [Streptosporangiaceae bacterium]